MKAADAPCMNQALKGLALARRFLEAEGLDLTVRAILPERDASSGDVSELEVVLEVSCTSTDWIRPEIENSKAWELYVKSDSLPSRVAGAIANNVREESPVYLTSMGKNAALQMMRSVALAREYLESGGHDIFVAPEFGTTSDGYSVMHAFVFPCFRDCAVTTDTDIHKTAGYVAAGVRQSSPPNLTTEDLAGMHQAMKLLALVRSYIEKEGLDVCMEPIFTEYYQDAETLNGKFHLTPMSNWNRRQIKDATEPVILLVGKDSEPGKTAGAIAQNARAGYLVTCAAMGPQAVHNCAKSIFLASKYLEAEGIVPFAMPEFSTSSDGGSVLRFHIVTEAW